ncbi:MAG: FGGY family carbohydrate kinase [Planctomycetaceae bacterium]|nr:FGGY family carbohydrate kinase [Planctomycetaceae bacterium]
MSEQNNPQFFIGVNLDDTGVYAIAVSGDGQPLAESSCQFDLAKHQSPKDFIEQPCESWWQASCYALGHLMSQLEKQGHSANQLWGIAVSSQPGSLAILDRSGVSLYPAIMAKDARAEEQAARLNLIGLEHVRKVGCPFRATDGIAKIVWFKEKEPDLYDDAMFAHQADYIVGKLKGNIDVTDPTIALTTGCDPCDNCWPDWLDYDMHLSVRERLPNISQAGSPVGRVTSDAARMTGLPAGLPIILGCNSQTAAFLSSGAKKPGDFFTIFDDTMQIDGITRRLLQYPQNIVKMNRLPDLQWFFSTRSNTGTEWINVWFNQQYACENIGQVDQLLPTHYLAFPNVRRGEIFPFNSNSAEGFISPATDNRLVQFSACIQGTTFVERMAYRKIDEMAENTDMGNIYTIGPWCQSDQWMQCRADGTERVVHRLPKTHGADFGAAILAAIGTKYRSLEEASNAMVHIEKSFYPNPTRMALFKEHFTAFQTTMEEQGYLL